MELITKERLIATAADRFRATNLIRAHWRIHHDGTSSQEIYDALRALPADAQEEDVLAITGDNRWTQNICLECGRDVPATVALGGEAHHPTDTATICVSCLQRAVALAASS